MSRRAASATLRALAAKATLDELNSASLAKKTCARTRERESQARRRYRRGGKEEKQTDRVVVPRLAGLRLEECRVPRLARRVVGERRLARVLRERQPRVLLDDAAKVDLDVHAALQGRAADLVSLDWTPQLLNGDDLLVRQADRAQVLDLGPVCAILRR